MRRTQAAKIVGYRAVVIVDDGVAVAAALVRCNGRAKANQRDIAGAVGFSWRN